MGDLTTQQTYEEPREEDKHPDMSQAFDQHFVGWKPETQALETTVDDPKLKESHGFVQYIVERDQARAELKAKELELHGVKGKNYDLLKKIDTLEEQIKELKAANKSASDLQALVNGNQGKNVTASRAKSGKGIRGGKKLPPLTTKNAPPSSPAVIKKKTCKHPKIPGMEALTEDSYEFYKYVGELHPNLKLSTVLEAEKKFAEADVNRDGTIDSEELDTILGNNKSMMFTKSQVEDILKGIDTDSTGSLDFLEVLTVLDKLYSNKKTDLPRTLQHQKSAVCSIQ